MESIGIEPTTSCMPCKGHAGEIGVGDAANGGQPAGVTDSARLESVVQAWPALPELIRAAIVMMVEASVRS